MDIVKDPDQLALFIILVQFVRIILDEYSVMYDYKGTQCFKDLVEAWAADRGDELRKELACHVTKAPASAMRTVTVGVQQYDVIFDYQVPLAALREDLPAKMRKAATNDKLVRMLDGDKACRPKKACTRCGLCVRGATIKSQFVSLPENALEKALAAPVNKPFADIYKSACVDGDHVWGRPYTAGSGSMLIKAQPGAWSDATENGAE